MFCVDDTSHDAADSLGLPVAALRSMCFVRDYECGADSGWIVSLERWAAFSGVPCKRLGQTAVSATDSGQLPRTASSIGAKPLIGTDEGGVYGPKRTLLRGEALHLFLSLHPSCGLAEYNAGDGSSLMSLDSFSNCVIRWASAPAVGNAVADLCSRPFDYSAPDSDLSAMLGNSDISFHLGLDVSAFIASGKGPILVLKEVAFASNMQDAAGLLGGLVASQSLILIPDRANSAAASTGGWLLPIGFLQSHRLPRELVLRGECVAAALVAWPALSLQAYNCDPYLPYNASGIVMRTATLLLADGLVDPSQISAPWSGSDVPLFVAPAVGVLDCGGLISSALGFSRLSPSSCPFDVQISVSFRASGFLRDGAAAAEADAKPHSRLLRLTFVADAHGGGWLVAPSWTIGLCSSSGDSVGSMLHEPMPLSTEGCVRSNGGVGVSLANVVSDTPIGGYLDEVLEATPESLQSSSGRHVLGSPNFWLPSSQEVGAAANRA